MQFKYPLLLLNSSKATKFYKGDGDFCLRYADALPEAAPMPVLDFGHLMASAIGNVERLIIDSRGKVGILTKDGKKYSFVRKNDGWYDNSEN